jgi:hypothetical protein
LETILENVEKLKEQVDAEAAELKQIKEELAENEKQQVRICSNMLRSNKVFVHRCRWKSEQKRPPSVCYWKRTLSCAKPFKYAILNFRFDIIH